MLARACRSLVFLVAVGVGVACGSSSGNVSAGPPSCTVTLSGAVSETHQCQAVVAYYQNQLAVVINATDDSEFGFAATLSSNDSLSAGKYDASSVQQEATSVQIATQTDATFSDPTTYASTAQNGNAMQGSFSLDVISVGPEVSSIYEGTRGSLDATLVPVGSSSANIVAHVDFVSIGSGSSHHGGDDEDDGGDFSGYYDAGSAYDAATPCIATLTGGINTAIPCTVEGLQVPVGEQITTPSVNLNLLANDPSDPVNGRFLDLQATFPQANLSTGTFDAANSTVAEGQFRAGDGGAQAMSSAQSGADTQGTFQFVVRSVGTSHVALNSDVQEWDDVHGSYTGTLKNTGGADIDVSVTF